MKLKKEKVLLIGTSFSAVPLLHYLKSLDYIVAVCGGFKDDPCHKYANESFFIDYSKRDELLQLCESEEFDYLVPSCNDYSYNSASYVATKLNKFYGFDKFEITNILHTKNGFRKFTIDNNLSVPQAIKYTIDLNLDILTLNYPLLVKPDDCFSGKGITKVTENSELKNAVEIARKNSKNNEVIIEEFVEGSLYSHSAFIQDGKILIDFFVDEFCTVYPYQVDSSSISYNLNEEVKNRIRTDIQKLITHLNISDGLLHTQFISDNTKFWLIETMRRCPGDLYGSLIKKSMNFNYSEFYCNPFLNKKSTLDRFKTDTKYIARHTVSAGRDLIFKSLKYDLESKKLDFYPLKESGQILKQAPYDKVGLVFYEFDTKEDLIKNTINMKDFFIVDNYDGIVNER